MSPKLLASAGVLAIMVLLAGCFGKPGTVQVKDEASLKGKHYELVCHFSTNGKDEGLHIEFTSCTGGGIKDGKVEAAEITYTGLDDCTSLGTCSRPGGKVSTTVYYPSPGGNSLEEADYYLVNVGGTGAFDVEVSFPVDPQGLGEYTVQIQALQWDMAASWASFGIPQMHQGPPLVHNEAVNLTSGAVL